MKRALVFIVLVLASWILPGWAQGQPPPPVWGLDIVGLDPITINVVVPGIEATGYDDFIVKVDHNFYAGATVSAAVTVQPWSGAAMGCSVNPVNILTGDISVRLMVSIIVPWSVSSGTYNGAITVTVIGTKL